MDGTAAASFALQQIDSMTPLFSKPNPIQPNEIAGYRNALQNTQGNILKSHGRSFTANVFLHFHGSQAALQTAIRPRTLLQSRLPKAEARS